MVRDQRTCVTQTGRWLGYVKLVHVRKVRTCPLTGFVSLWEENLFSRAVRRFAMRDLVELAKTEAERDYNIFRTSEARRDHLSPLEFGTIVVSPKMLDGAGRVDQYQCYIIDKTKLVMPKGID